MSNYSPDFTPISKNGVLIEKKQQKKIAKKMKLKTKKKKGNGGNDVVYFPLTKILAIVLICVLAFNFIQKTFDFTIFGNDKQYLSSELETPNTQEDNIAATVNIKAIVNKGTYTGSGVIFEINDKEIVILTAKHVVDFDQNVKFEVKFVKIKKASIFIMALIPPMNKYNINCIGIGAYCPP